MSINEDGEDKSVKNSSSIRTVPLHNDLIRLGLIQYADSLPNDGKLFPALSRDAKGRYHTNVSHAFGRAIRKNKEIDSSIKPFHGFRHTFKTLCREPYVNIPKEYSHRITGHTESDEGDAYGTFTHSALAAQINKFPSIKNIEELVIKSVYL